LRAVGAASNDVEFLIVLKQASEVLARQRLVVHDDGLDAFHDSLVW
jgi:hypothetical protein